MTIQPSKSLVSILLVARDAAPTIGLALASLLAQDNVDWECQIVDDASTDGTANLLSRLIDPRFRVQRSSKRLGRGGARNLALERAKGCYLASLDADDFLFPGALEAQMRVLEDAPSLSACTGSLLLFSPNDRPIGRRRTQLSPGVHQIRSPLTTRSPLGPTMVRRNLVGANRFQESLKRSEDRDFYERVLDRGRVRVLPDLTYAYRWNLTLENVMLGLENREALFCRSLLSSPLRSASQLVWTRWKRLCYPALGSWGLWEVLNRWRAVPATAEEVVLFEQTLSALSRVKVFSSP